MKFSFHMNYSTTALPFTISKYVVFFSHQDEVWIVVLNTGRVYSNSAQVGSEIR